MKEAENKTSWSETGEGSKVEVRPTITPGRKYYLSNGYLAMVYEEFDEYIHGSYYSNGKWNPIEWDTYGFATQPKGLDFRITHEHWVPEVGELVYAWNSYLPYSRLRMVGFYEGENTLMGLSVLFENFAPFPYTTPEWAIQLREELKNEARLRPRF